MDIWVLVLEGLAIGCLLGLTGAGGGILAVPALMSTQGWTVAQAAPVGLLAVTLAALVGATEGLLKKIVRYRAALWIALVSIPSAHYGIQLAQHTSPIWLSILFSMVMLIVAYRVFFNKVNDVENPPCKVNQSTGRFIWNAKTASVLGFIGVIAGLLTGMLGVGGGFIIVPALRKMTDLDMRSIVATSLMIICLIGGVSIFLNIWEGFSYPINITTTFVLACVIGMIVGRRCISIIQPRTVQKIFAIVVIAVAIYLLGSVFIEL